MTAPTICSDFGAPKNKVCHCFHFSCVYLPWSDGAGFHDLSFLNVEFSASFFTLLFYLYQEALYSSSLSAVRVLDHMVVLFLVFQWIYILFSWVFCQNLLCMYWDHHMIFILNLSVWFITLICKYWKILVSLRINATWSWCMILLMYCWILSASILLSIFTSVFISDTGLWLFGGCVICVWFWYQDDVVLVEWV